MRYAVQVRMSEEMYNLLDKVATKDNTSIADVIRKLVSKEKANL